MPPVEDLHTEALYHKVTTGKADDDLWGTLRNALLDAHTRGMLDRSDEPRVYTLRPGEVEALADAVSDIAETMQALEEHGATGKVHFEVRLHTGAPVHLFDLEVTL